MLFYCLAFLNAARCNSPFASITFSSQLTSRGGRVVEVTQIYVVLMNFDFDFWTLSHSKFLASKR